MPQWTKQQNDAINAKNRNIIVSAAAGSGKTAVLVERVITMITDEENPVDIDRLLIVTFTNAAAAEMRFRISRSLKSILKSDPNNKNARRQLSLLSNAKICTIDSFCISLVRENFYELGISQDFTNMDESELSILEDNAINDILDEYFEKDDKDFISLIELFTTPSSDSQIIAVIKKILRFIYAKPFPYITADKMLELYNPQVPFESTCWYEYIEDEINELLDYSYRLAQINKSLAEDGIFENPELQDKLLFALDADLLQIRIFRSAIDESLDSLMDIDEAVFANLPRSTKITNPQIFNKIKAFRDIYKKILKDDIPAFFISKSDEYTADMNTLYPVLKKLLELVRAVDERLFETKKEKNKFSFSDIEHFAITLLFNVNDKGDIVKSELAKKLSEYFYEILVDEYQDTNEAQDLLFTYLSNGKNLFTVGDVKQSIYRFRLAVPDIFNYRRKTYKDYDENDNASSSKIILDKNFRSRKDICSYINFVFSLIMSERVGEITYDESEYLNYGASYNDSDVPSAQIKILDGVKGEDAAKKEAAYIAKTIIKKVNSGELIKDGDTYRPIRYGDFAILLRSLKNRIDDYVSVLTDYGIPVVCDNAGSLFENNEIKIILSYLRAINNPTLDIPLLAVMSSPIYSFTPDELAKIRLENKRKSFYFSVSACEDEKALAFLNDLKELRRLSVTMSVAGFIRYLVENRGISSYINALGNGELRYQNVLKLISFAESFDSGDNVGLTSFIRYIDSIIKSGRGVEAASLGATSENCVSIMSVHHSKGLEFPVCILAGASRRYNKSDLSEKLLLNNKYGFGLKFHNEKQLYQYQTVPYYVIKNKNSFELMSENLRVLYVAMTRAKEQFITFITCENISKKANKLSGALLGEAIDPYITKGILNDGDFLLMCALSHPDGEALRICSGTPVPEIKCDFPLDIEIAYSSDDVKEAQKINFEPYSEDIIKQIDNKLSFNYERMSLSTFSSKLAASSLDESGNSFEFFASSKPAYMSKASMTPAERGTAMHTFMQFCDYKNANDDLEQEIIRLTDSGALTKMQADCLDREKLKGFFKSDMAKRISKAEKVYKELKLTSFVKACDVYDVDYDDDVLIQGIADCVFEEDGALVLLDYKTDRVNDENELLERYKKQISFYRFATQKTLEKPVTEAVLYSFHLQKECRYK